MKALRSLTALAFALAAGSGMAAEVISAVTPRQGSTKRHKPHPIDHSLKAEIKAHNDAVNRRNALKRAKKGK